jgi:hypothetical protein
MSQDDHRAEAVADLADWIIPPPSAETANVVTAPITVPGWEEPPWVKLRPLTYEEDMRRQSIGWYEEYELPADGCPAEVIRVRQWCDRWALAEFDFRHCVLDFRLPELAADGTVSAARFVPGQPSRNVEVLKRLPPALSEWLAAAIARVNRRRPEDAPALADAKNA